MNSRSCRGGSGGRQGHADCAHSLAKVLHPGRRSADVPPRPRGGEGCRRRRHRPRSSAPAPAGRPRWRERRHSPRPVRAASARRTRSSPPGRPFAGDGGCGRPLRRHAPRHRRHHRPPCSAPPSTAGRTLAVLAFEPEDPAGYGRVILDASGHVAAISRAFRRPRRRSGRSRLCNSGIMAIRAGAALDALADIGNEQRQGRILPYRHRPDRQDAGLRHRVGAGRSARGDGDQRPRPARAGSRQPSRRIARARALERATLAGRPRRSTSATDTKSSARTSPWSPSSSSGRACPWGDGATIRAFSHLEGATVAPGAVVPVAYAARLRPGDHPIGAAALAHRATSWMVEGLPRSAAGANVSTTFSYHRRTRVVWAPALANMGAAPSPATTTES